MFTLGYNVRVLRLQAGLSKRELGELCGVTEWAIRDIESRGGSPRLDLLKALRTIFDVNYDKLLGDVDHMTRSELDDAIALVNAAIAHGQKSAKRDLTALIERLHSLDRVAQPEGPVARRRSRQLQLPVPEAPKRADGRRR